MGSGGGRSNIVAIDDSVQSLVDFDLSESKFTMGAFDHSNRDPSPAPAEKLMPSKQGSTPKSGGGVTKPVEPAAALYKSGSGSRRGSGTAGADDMSMEESDFGLSESNFSHSMLSNKIGSFATSQTSAGATPSFVKNGPVGTAGMRDRAATQVQPKPSYKMNKNLIIEDDEELIDETDGLGTSSKKGEKVKEEEDSAYSDDFDF